MSTIITISDEVGRVLTKGRQANGEPPLNAISRLVMERIRPACDVFAVASTVKKVSPRRWQVRMGRRLGAAVDLSSFPEVWVDFSDS